MKWTSVFLFILFAGSIVQAEVQAEPNQSWENRKIYDANHYETTGIHDMPVENRVIGGRFYGALEEEPNSPGIIWGEEPNNVSKVFLFGDNERADSQTSSEKKGEKEGKDRTLKVGYVVLFILVLVLLFSIIDYFMEKD